MTSTIRRASSALSTDDPLHDLAVPPRAQGAELSRTVRTSMSSPKRRSSRDISTDDPLCDSVVPPTAIASEPNSTVRTSLCDFVVPPTAIASEPNSTVRTSMSSAKQRSRSVILPDDTLYDLAVPPTVSGVNNRGKDSNKGMPLRTFSSEGNSVEELPHINRLSVDGKSNKEASAEIPLPAEAEKQQRFLWTEGRQLIPGTAAEPNFTVTTLRPSAKASITNAPLGVPPSTPFDQLNCENENFSQSLAHSKTLQPPIKERRGSTVTEPSFTVTTSMAPSTRTTSIAASIDEILDDTGRIPNSDIEPPLSTNSDFDVALKLACSMALEEGEGDGSGLQKQQLASLAMNQNTREATVDNDSSSKEAKQQKFRLGERQQRSSSIAVEPGFTVTTSRPLSTGSLDAASLDAGTIRDLQQLAETTGNQARASSGQRTTSFGGRRESASVTEPSFTVTTSMAPSTRTTSIAASIDGILDENGRFPNSDIEQAPPPLRTNSDFDVALKLACSMALEEDDTDNGGDGSGLQRQPTASSAMNQNTREATVDNDSSSKEAKQRKFRLGERQQRSSSIAVEPGFTVTTSRPLSTGSLDAASLDAGTIRDLQQLAETTGNQARASSRQRTMSFGGRRESASVTEPSFTVTTSMVPSTRTTSIAASIDGILDENGRFPNNDIEQALPPLRTNSDFDVALKLACSMALEEDDTDNEGDGSGLQKQSTASSAMNQNTREATVDNNSSSKEAKQRKFRLGERQQRSSSIAVEPGFTVTTSRPLSTGSLDAASLDAGTIRNLQQLTETTGNQARASSGQRTMSFGGRRESASVTEPSFTVTTSMAPSTRTTSIAASIDGILDENGRFPNSDIEQALPPLRTNSDFDVALKLACSMALEEDDTDNGGDGSGLQKQSTASSAMNQNTREATVDNDSSSKEAKQRKFRLGERQQRSSSIAVEPGFTVTTSRPLSTGSLDAASLDAGTIRDLQQLTETTGNQARASSGQRTMSFGGRRESASVTEPSFTVTTSMVPSTRTTSIAASIDGILDENGRFPNNDIEQALPPLRTNSDFDVALKLACSMALEEDDTDNEGDGSGLQKQSTASSAMNQNTREATVDNDSSSKEAKQQKFRLGERQQRSSSIAVEPGFTVTTSRPL